jgi:hypothetical protein
MKIGFKRGDHWYSTVIRLILRTDWSHSAIAMQDDDGQWRLYESTMLKNGQPKAGVHDYLLTDALALQYEWIDRGASGDAVAKARYAEIKGLPYDFFSLFAFIFVKIRDRKRIYCNELTMHLLGGDSDKRVTFENLLYFILRK